MGVSACNLALWGVVRLHCACLCICSLYVYNRKTKETEVQLERFKNEPHIVPSTIHLPAPVSNATGQPSHAQWYWAGNSVMLRLPFSGKY